MRLYLVRHGQTAWNFEQRAQGHCDTVLDEMGRIQAIQVSCAFQGVQVDRLMTSDLARSAETAKRIAEVVGVEPEVTALLRERCFGVLEGQPYDEVRATIDREAAQNGYDPLEHAPAEGESLRHVWNRIQPIAADLDARRERTIIVSHGGTIGLMIARMIGAGPEAARAFRITNASISELFQRDDGTWAIERLNDRSHLEVTREGSSA